MPKKKHRLSWLYEDTAARNVAWAPEEDTLAVSPVEVAYPFDIIAENALTKEPSTIETEEAPNDVPAEAAPAEEYPIFEEAVPAEYYPTGEEAVPAEYYPTGEEAVPAEDYPTGEEAVPAEDYSTGEEAVPAEDYSTGEEAAPAEDYPTGEEAAPAKYYPTGEEAVPAEDYSTGEEAVPAEDYSTGEEAVPAEDYPTGEEAAPAEDYPIVEEEPATYPPIEEAKADSGLGASQESKADDSDEEASGNAEKPKDKAGEVVLICTSCTIMLLIEYDGPCPYSVTSLMGSYHGSYSWLLHTTCVSCVNKHRPKKVSRGSFSNECLAAFTAALLSEEFIKRTSWFEVAGKVCRKPIRIVMDIARRSVAYEKIDVMREETTGNCRIRGLKSAGSRVGKGGRSELIESFVPGGFM